MKATSGVWGSHFGAGLLRTTALVALALGITLALLFVAGPVEADGPDEFTVPVVLEEGRTPPKVVEPPSVREQRQVQGDGASITETSVVLVGNNEKTDAGTLQLNRDRGQAFTTGSNSHGYKLTSVQIASNVNQSVGNWDVSIVSAGSAGPGTTQIGDLSEPASLTTGIDNSFTASGNGIDLAANTTYYIFIDMDAEHSAHWKSTNDDGENANPATGWSIGNASYFRMVSSTTTTWTQLGNNNLKIRVNGYAKVPPALTTVEINGSSLVLNYDKDLDTTSVPAAGRFTMEAAGTSHTATAITVSGKQVRLTVPAVKAGQFVTVTYSKPGSNPLKGTNGLAVDAFSNTQATNNTPSLTPPPPPADTPASGTLISNIGKQVGQVIGPVSEQAQSFTTGSNSFGYRLTSVEMRVNPQNAVSNYSVSIRENSSGIPGTTLGTLNSGQLSTGWQNAGFPASGNGIDLAASSTYWVVASINSDVNMQTTNLDTEDSGGAVGWSMGDGRLFNHPNWDPNNSDTGAIKLAVKGYAKTEATSTDPLSQRPRDPITVTFTNADGEEETVENRAASAERDTLWSYFYDSCQARKELTNAEVVHDYSQYTEIVIGEDAQGNAITKRVMTQARNGWKWVWVQDANGNITGTKAQTVDECASHSMYLRQQTCANEDWRDRNPHILDAWCPTYRTW